jgi:hypothetical protein
VRAYRGWIAAMLLTALALVGGPEMLDTALTPAHVQAAQTTWTGSTEYGDKRDLRARDVAYPHRKFADRGAPDRRWVPALPPSPSQSHVPGSVRLAAGAPSPQAPSARVAGGHRPPRGGACSPETLQIFRC